MEKRSEEDFAKLISDCDILFLPDNSTIEEALSAESSNLLLSKTNESKKHERRDQTPAVVITTNDEDEFEAFFQKSKLKNKSAIVSSNSSEWKPNNRFISF